MITYSDLLKSVLLFFFCGSLWGQSQEIQRYNLQDHIKFPTYAWPRTLLTWPVDYKGQKINESQLWLRDNLTGQPVPFQLSQHISAQISFFSDLPSGGERSFSLMKGQRLATLATPVKSKKTRAFVEISNGVFSVRIPASQAFSGSETVPGPVYSIRGKKGWLGQSKILSPTRKVLNVNTKCLDAGELYQRWRVAYAFAGGGQYTAFIKVISGYDFFEFHEVITGLDKRDQVVNEMDWTGFDAKYRFGTQSNTLVTQDGKWPSISEGVNMPYSNEDPHWSATVQEDVAEEMWVKLSPYSGNARRELHSCFSFWDDRPDAEELGVFILDYGRWRDQVYGIWQPAHDMMVRFRYRDNTLGWMWPVMTGERSTAININTVVKGEAEVERIRRLYQDSVKRGRDMRFSFSTMRLRYNQLLQQVYGPISLDRCKDWVLEYPEDAARPDKNRFSEVRYDDVDEFIGQLYRSALVRYMLGQNSWPGANAIQNGFYGGWVAATMTKIASQMTPQQRKRVDAILLAGAYVLSGDAMHPLRSSLAGCPNMVSNGVVGPMIAAYLYPDHPMSQEWRDHYSKYHDLSSFYFTRPDVDKYDSLGGRWTESLACYNWTHMRQMQVAEMTSMLTDGVNRWCSNSTAQRGRWLVDMLSSPIYNPDPYQRHKSFEMPSEWKPGDPFDADLGFSRQYPSHGAHSSGTTIEPTPVVNHLGYFLRNYDPIIAENLLWVETDKNGHRGNGHLGWANILEPICNSNNGTRPELKSCKYTGHGIVLRSGVGTPEELSVHLDQVDRGSNYRWGRNGEGGSSGTLFYFADGKVWTGHEHQDSGDHATQDTDGLTNFGVMKDGSYHCVGNNILERPLFDMEFAQFAEITSRRDESRYSWPEYDSRSIMLVGTDYFLIYDKTGCSGAVSGRFSWFIEKSGEYPKIVFLLPNRARPDHWRKVSTYLAEGFQRDAHANSLVLVTHKIHQVKMMDLNENQVQLMGKAPVFETSEKSKNNLPRGIYRIETPSSIDTVFRSANALYHEDQDVLINGTSGLLRNKKNGDLEMALFEPGKIIADSLMITVDNPDMSFSLVRKKDVPNVSGICQTTKPGKVTLSLGKRQGLFYLNGEAVKVVSKKGAIHVEIPSGKHRWEFTTFMPTPIRPQIQHTVNFSAGAKIFFDPHKAVASYLIELSKDGGNSWSSAGQTSTSPAILKGLTNGKKVHVRLTAVNRDKKSLPSHEYPLYVSDQVPEFPDGLDLVLSNGRASLSWGQVLGVDKYRLYRRQMGQSKFKLIYEGPSRFFVDSSSEIVKHSVLPGSDYNEPYKGVVYEYAVSSANGNGESEKSAVRNTDPTTWINWYPHIEDLSYRRDTEFWKPPYVPARMQPPSHY